MTKDEAGEEAAPRRSRFRRGWDIVKFPPPAEGQLFTSRASGASYLGAWGLTATHLILWILIAASILTAEAVTIGNSALSFAATCLLIWMVMSIHHRFQIRARRKGAPRCLSLVARSLGPGGTTDLAAREVRQRMAGHASWTRTTFQTRISMDAGIRQSLIPNIGKGRRNMNGAKVRVALVGVDG